ncbi:hypothetical protein KXW37_008937 [Aspergillus fumigatus]|nr:hypothetical protein KXW37_008937 [Aspergillus fumigatus]
MNIVIPYMVNPDEGNMQGKVGFVFGGLGVIATVLCYLYIPDLKGRTFEEIDLMFDNRVPPRKMGGAVPINVDTTLPVTSADKPFVSRISRKPLVIRQELNDSITRGVPANQRKRRSSAASSDVDDFRVGYWLWLASRTWDDDRVGYFQTSAAAHCETATVAVLAGHCVAAARAPSCTHRATMCPMYCSPCRLYKGQREHRYRSFPFIASDLLGVSLHRTTRANSPRQKRKMGSIDTVGMGQRAIDQIISELSLNEKVALLSGVDAWHTFAIPRLGIPSIRTTDGPNGARGTRYFNGVPSACLPCGTALGATFDRDLIFSLGQLLAAECRAKGAHVLLGPTINIQRGPLGGRGFESFSEDPVLSGLAAASYCSGVQDGGVVPTLKHLVCNDQEHERVAVSALVTPRALREIYLLPFQLAIQGARPGAVMTSYNKVNGLHASENPGLIRDILRGEWGYEGAVISDWFGTYSVADAVNAGLDLEMPGPTRFRGPALMHALTSNKVSEKTLNERVRKVLELVQLASRAGVPEYAPERKLNRPEDRALLRRAAGESVVLLKNDKNDSTNSPILPLDREKTTLVIGPNADLAAYCGGGSASLLAYYTVTPRQGIADKCGAEQVVFSQGCYGHKELPLLGEHLRTIETGQPGYTFRVYTEPPPASGSFKGSDSRTPVDELHMTNSSAFLMDYSHPQISGDTYYATLEGTFEPPESGVYEFGLTVAGTGLLYIDGVLVVDNKTVQRAGTSFFGIGTVEERGERYLEAGKKHHVFVEFGTAPTSNLQHHHGVVSFGPGGLRLGGCRKLDTDTAIQQAVQSAAQADQVVVCVGLSGDWESEGFDRPHMDLPPGTDELVNAVLAVQPNAVIVVQSGTPVTMPWADKAKALLQAWYGGNEAGNGIADVLFGDVNPSAKLPLTFPRELSQNPSYLSYRSERGRVLYSEDIYVGYRYYDTTGQPPLFRFGHGLSYSTFHLRDLTVRETAPYAANIKESSLRVSVTVSNTSARPGAEVVLVYVRPPAAACSVGRPVRELKGYEKVMLQPGETREVSITIPLGLATSFWDEGCDAWLSEKGLYFVEAVGTGEGNTLVAPLTVQVSRVWNGL